LAADINAVRLGGRDAAANALERVAVASRAFDFLLQQYAAPLWQARSWPVDLYEGLRRLLAEPARAEQLQALRAALLAAPSDRWDSHPPLGERLRLIASLRGGPATTDQRAARTLLGDPDATERRMAAQLAAFATKGAAATPLTWDQAAVQVYGPALEQRADQLAAATVALCDGQGTGQLAQTLELLAAGEGDVLAYYLQPDLEQVPIQERERATTQVLGWYLRAALARELVRRHGCHWATSWAEEAGVNGWHADAGALEDLVQRAMRGPEGVAAVRATLGLGHPVRYPHS
jgi:hypothetical protein